MVVSTLDEARTVRRVPIACPVLPEPEALWRDFQSIVSSRKITNGAFVRRLEELVRQYTGARHAVAVSSCTSGLILTLASMRLHGEVILPSFTFAATAHAVVWNGLTPVFADCCADTFTIDPADVARKITPQTAAIMGAAIFGLPPDYAALESLAAKHGVPLVFDSAQALGGAYHGQPCGAFGGAEVFSLSPTKVLTAAEGGVVATDDDELAARLTSARDYGKAADGHDIVSVGLNARMSEFHALLAVHGFGQLDAHVERRQQLRQRYLRRLSGVPGLRAQHIPAGLKSSNNYFVVCVDESRCGCDRATLYEELKRRGYETKKYFHPPAHLLSAYASVGERYRGQLPVTEAVSDTALALPLYNDMPTAQVDEVCEAVRDICGS